MAELGRIFQDLDTLSFSLLVAHIPAFLVPVSGPQSPKAQINVGGNKNVLASGSTYSFSSAQGPMTGLRVSLGRPDAVRPIDQRVEDSGCAAKSRRWADSTRKQTVGLA